MEEIRQTIGVIVRQAFDLLSAFFDFVSWSSVPLPAPTFAGIITVVFLLGLLIGRISKRGLPEALEDSREGEADRVVLDLERLTPLRLSAEEEAETEVMDLSSLRPGGSTDATARSDSEDLLGPNIAPGH